MLRIINPPKLITVEHAIIKHMAKPRRDSGVSGTVFASEFADIMQGSLLPETTSTNESADGSREAVSDTRPNDFVG
jgi:hypothetical protein